MKKIALEIADIKPSGSAHGAYALVLNEKNGKRKLPIVIGGNEAQAIAIELESMTPSRPLTHDLFKSFAHAYAIQVDEIIIYNLIEGIFFAKVITSQDGKKAEIDSRTSDAVALAVRFKCPIFCYDFILDTAGVNEQELREESMDDDDFDVEEDLGRSSALSVEELEQELDRAIEQEDYERASELRDEISKRKKK
ncbi:MAG: bifunctional nuclease domain-containing protein [Flavobacteriales bacterium]